MSDESATTGERPVLAERQGAIVRVTLNRSRKANALDAGTVDALGEILDDAALFAGARALVLIGEGKHFCAGFDFSGIDALSDGDLVLRFLRIEAILQRLYHAPYLTIACAHGAAIGAGADLFVACDYRIAATSAQFRMPGWRFGIALGTRRLADRIGADAAREVLSESRTLTAEAARELGLATDVAERDAWPALIEARAARDRISSDASRMLRTLTVDDHRDADMAALVESAIAQPSLKARMLAYRTESEQTPRA